MLERMSVAATAKAIVFFMSLDYEPFQPATMDESFEKCVESAID